MSTSKADGTGQAGRPKRQVGWQGRWAWSTDVPTLTATILGVTTSRTKINIKIVIIIERVASFKSSLLPKNYLQRTQTLQIN
jgi:hypothetical protein